jgi:LPXTG-site transpeptidase (sortase) family protein
MKTIEPPKHNRPQLPADPAASSAQTGHTTASHAAVGDSAGSTHQAFTLHTPEHVTSQHVVADQASHLPQHASRETAASIIRGKIERLYEAEPTAKDEIKILEQQHGAYSKHQEFVSRLVATGRPLSEIQEAWHAYYASLSDAEKHEVWQEFYSSYERASKFAQALMTSSTASNTTKAKDSPQSNAHKTPDMAAPNSQSRALHDRPSSHGHDEPIRPYALSAEQKAHRRTAQQQTIASIKSQLIAKISSRNRISKSGNLKSLAFGLATGTVFMILVLFSFFNERFITPFIMPGRADASSRLIIDPNESSAVGPENKIIIPKLNVEVPVVYGAASIEEKDIQKELESGVVHYPITEKPGELGNAVIVGHSSNNILNKGKYKFAFLMLKKLSEGDTLYVHYNGTRYVYSVYETKIVEATDVGVLDNTDRPAIVTLITCDPPGTSLKRLIVRAVQISPEPSGNTESTAAELPEQPELVPGNSPSLFQRIRDWIL